MLSYNTQSIERVMSNLITNAIKYSPNNSRIKIRAEIAKNPKYLEVSVEDNGIGISAEHQKMIFERFYRIENQVHTIKGTGLGLHLVKMAIEKHHQGKVFVKSKLNEGSTFGFWLPIDEADIKEISLKELKDKSLNEITAQNQDKQDNYTEYKIEKIDDYSKKAEFDAKYINANTAIQQEETKEENIIQEEFKEENPNKNNPIKQENPKQENSDDEWEISFEVRDN